MKVLALVTLGAITGFSLPALGADTVKGQTVFQHWCQPCHGAGPGHPGTAALEVKYNGTLPPLIEERKDLTADTIKLFVRQGISVMAPFRKSEITDADLDALTSYLASTAKAAKK